MKYHIYTTLMAIVLWVILIGAVCMLGRCLSACGEFQTYHELGGTVEVETECPVCECDLPEDGD